MVSPLGQATLPLAANHAHWADLAERVRSYAPDVVVLIARKAPRIREALGLELAPGALIVSDLAIPFLGNVLVDARVAIIDDVVNVGSTIATAHRRVLAAGAEETRVFAVAHVERENQLEGLDVEYVSDETLDAPGLREFAYRIPEELQGLAKPYDLDFPVLVCSLAAPFTSFDDFLAQIRALNDDSRVWDLTSQFGARVGIRRAAVDLASEPGTHRKVRFYFHTPTGCLHVVPIALVSTMPTTAPQGGALFAHQVWNAVFPALPPEELDAAGRLRMFCDSLSLGTEFLSEHREWIRPTAAPLDIEDAELILGPRVRQLEVNPDDMRVSVGPVVVDAAESALPSPFFETALELDFPKRVLERAGASDILSVFPAIFEELATLVGAQEPAEYAWSGGADRDAVLADPYKRLRIGLTGTDLVNVVQLALGRSHTDEARTRLQISQLLDHFIDAGSVVPTTAVVDRRVYRIYRKGESGTRIAVADRTHFALKSYGKPISLTRLAKLGAALSFTDDPDPLVEVRTLARGNVQAFKGDLLDEGTDVSFWLRDTRRIVRVDAD